MKSKTLFFFLTLGLSVVADTRAQLKITDGTLAGWTTNGFQPAFAKNDQSLTVPAGTSLSRTFSGGMIAVHLVSRPSFSDNDSDWPILVVGPAALVFRREGNVGQMILISPDGKVQSIKESVALDAAGLSCDPVDVLFAYDPETSMGFVGIGDQLRSFHSTDTPVVDVALFAGSSEAWIADSLEVVLLDPSQRKAVATSAEASKSSATVSPSPEASAALQRLIAHQKYLKAVSGSIVDRAALSADKAKFARPSAEIFTPPSARFLSAEDLRALVAKSARK